MKFSDFLIIYLSCGAPFGVYFFLQNRTKLTSMSLWLNSFLTTIVWFPYAFQFLHEFITNKLGNYKFAKRNKLDSIRKQRIDEIEKEISNIIFQKKINVSLFDFRETFERFAGLTIADQISNETRDIGENEKELFRIPNVFGEKTLKKNINIGAKCLNRRNRSRLKVHQINAREDFLQMFSNLHSQIKQSEAFQNLAIEFVKLLDDVESQKSLHNIFSKSLQISSDLSVNELENEVWKSKQNKPVSVKKIPLNLQTISATATIRKPD